MLTLNARGRPTLSNFRCLWRSSWFFFSGMFHNWKEPGKLQGLGQCRKFHILIRIVLSFLNVLSNFHLLPSWIFETVLTPCRPSAPKILIQIVLRHGQSTAMAFVVAKWPKRMYLWVQTTDLGMIESSEALWSLCVQAHWLKKILGLEAYPTEV